MAKIKLSAPVQDIRGTMSGFVYSNWKGQAYTRNPALSVSNPNSLFQERVRKCIEDLSKYWQSTLTAAQRAAWDEYAQQRGAAANQNKVIQRGSLVMPLGKNLTGKNAYIGTNILLAKHDEAYNHDAPLGRIIPSEPKDFGVTYTPGVTPKFTLTWTDPANLEVGGHVCCWIVCPGQFHKQERDWVAKGLQTLDIETLRGASGIAIPITIGLYRFQVAAVNTKGERGPGSNIVTVNVTSLT